MPSYIVLAAGVAAQGTGVDYSLVVSEPVVAADPASAVLAAVTQRGLEGSRVCIAIPASQWNRFNVHESVTYVAEPIT